MAKAATPSGNMGVYKRLDDVPSHRRLARFAGEYDGRDTWRVFVEENHPVRSDYKDEELRRFEKRWKGHMADRGRHHALATPEDVEKFCAERVEENTLSTAYKTYWRRLENFYQWLQTHPDHPHVYHPPLMAAAEYPNAAKLWEYRIDRTGVGNR